MAFSSNLNQFFPTEETKLASGTATALPCSFQWYKPMVQTSVAASVISGFYLLTELGQTFVNLIVASQLSCNVLAS